MHRPPPRMARQEQTAAELRESARALALRFGERAFEADQRRAPADESIRELEDSAILSSLVPRSHGGLEIDLRTLCDVLTTLGEGCTSTAWIASFYVTYGWVAALFPKRARQEFFADGAGFPSCFTLAPRGRATAERDGYRLSGSWQWGTGISHARWALLTGLAHDANGNVETRLFAVPRSQVRVEDTWFTDGMRGTASHDVIVEDVHVPQHRTLAFQEFSSQTSPGAREHENPLYRLPMPPLFVLLAALPAVGTARAAVAQFRDTLRDRVLFLTKDRQHEKASAQMRLARAHVDAHAAWLLVCDIADRLTVSLASDEPISVETRVEIRMTAWRAVTLARDAVRSIGEASGASAHFESNPLQRMRRDLETMASHYVFDTDTTAELAGRVLLGFEPEAPIV